MHICRGEQFRHSQNVRKDRTHLSSSHTYNSPTLPFSLTWPPATDSEPETEVESPSATVLPDTSDVLKVVAESIPPKSLVLKLES